MFALSSMLSVLTLLHDLATGFPCIAAKLAVDDITKASILGPSVARKALNC